ncbi:MAG: hypothetical protein HZB36_04510 [Candidatus Omnitrophica bacterium]|nr:hypothetical protein [Candidatus Omnitrophota bacterium]
MKKIIVAVVVAVFILGFTGKEVWARAKKTQSSQGAVEKNKKLSSKKTKELLEQKRLELENTSWDVEMKLASGEKKMTDRLIFKDKQFSSEGFVLGGFKPTSYSLTMKDDGVIVFETMQPGENGGTVFWKGEFGPDNISVRGITSQVSPDQTSQDLYFSGLKVQEKKSESVTINKSEER